MNSDKESQRLRNEERKLEMKDEAKVAAVSDAVMKICGLLPIRFYDEMRQKEGIDFILDMDEARWFVDEKSASKYYYKDLQTYTVEVINSHNKGDSGWINNGIAKTSHYLLVWIRADDKNLSRIWRWEGMFVEKNVIKKILDDMGYSPQELRGLVVTKGTDIPQAKSLIYTLYENERSYSKERINVFLAYGHREKNVNLQFPKSWFESFCIRHIIWLEDEGVILDETKNSEIPEDVVSACLSVRYKHDEEVADLPDEEEIERLIEELAASHK